MSKRDFTHMDVEELATLADNLRKLSNDSKRSLAERVGRERANVSRALNRPKGRDLSALRDILAYYDVEVKTTPKYAVSTDFSESIEPAEHLTDV